MKTIDRVWENKNNGCCCGENIMTLSLEDLDWKPEARTDMIKVMRAYCGGLDEGLACGALCAARAALFLAEEDKAKARDELGPELMSWFKERFGTWNCADIIEGDLERRQTLCPTLVADTYDKLYGIFKDAGAI